MLLAKMILSSFVNIPPMFGFAELLTIIICFRVPYKESNRITLSSPLVVNAPHLRHINDCKKFDMNMTVNVGIYDTSYKFASITIWLVMP
jgi:hypothetical protein